MCGYTCSTAVYILLYKQKSVDNIEEVGSLLPPCGSYGLNLDYQGGSRSLNSLIYFVDPWTNSWLIYSPLLGLWSTDPWV